MALSDQEEFELLSLEREKASGGSARPPLAGGYANALAGPDMMLSLGSGAVAAPVSGLAGIAGSVLPGPEGQGADWLRKTQEALTLRPKTELGSALTNLASKPGELLAKGADIAGSKVAEKLGPAAGAGVNAVIQAAPLALGLRKTAVKAPTLTEQAVSNARKSGFALTPDEGGGGVVSKTAAGLAGEPKLAKLISMNNKDVASGLIAEDFGLPKETQINRQTLEQIRESAGASYDQVRQAGTVTLDTRLKMDVANAARDLRQAASELPHRTENPLLKTVNSILSKDSLDASTVVSEVINLRSEAKAAFAKGESQLGRGNLGIAEALEGVLDRHLTNVKGDPTALQNLREARATIAKTYAADKAINPVTGDFNPQAYAHMLRNKVPLTGGAKKVAEAATAFPRSMQNPSGLPPPGASAHDLWLGGLGRLAGLPVAADLALGFARPIGRSMIASDLGQGMIGEKMPPLTPGLLQMIAASQAQQKR